MNILLYFTFNNLMHVIDIAIIWFILYKLIQFVEGTRALQILFGVGFVILVKVVSWYLGLVTLSWIMDQIITWAPIAVVVIFQQEIRRGLESLGRRLVIRRARVDNSKEHQIGRAHV